MVRLSQKEIYFKRSGELIDVVFFKQQQQLLFCCFVLFYLLPLWENVSKWVYTAGLFFLLLFLCFTFPGTVGTQLKMRETVGSTEWIFSSFFFISRILAARMTGSHTADLCVRYDSRNDRKKKKMNQTDKKKLPERCEREKGGGMAVCA